MHGEARTIVLDAPRYMSQTAMRCIFFRKITCKPPCCIQADANGELRSGEACCVPVVRPVAWGSIVCAPICKGCCMVRFDGVRTGSCNRKVDTARVFVCRTEVCGMS